MMEPESYIRRAAILDAAVKVANKRGGWINLTRQGIAAEAECSDGLVNRYFGDMHHIRRSLMEEAIRKQKLSIIAQSLVANDGYAEKTPAEIKTKALLSLLG